jgi:hypothetical protein
MNQMHALKSMLPELADVVHKFVVLLRESIVCHFVRLFSGIYFVL